MISFVALLAIVFGFVVPNSAAPQCHLEELQGCLDIAIDYINSLPKRSLPVTEEDVTVMCDEIGKAFKCSADFEGKCMTPLQKELEKLILEGVQTLRRDFCTPGSHIRNQYLKHSTCLNTVAQSDNTRDNFEYLMVIFEKFLNMPNNERLPFMCCGYQKMYHSIRRNAVDMCGEDAARAGEEMIEMAIAQLPNIACQGYDGDSDECQAKLPPTGSKPSEAFNENPVYKFIRNALKNYME